MDPIVPRWNHCEELGDPSLGSVDCSGVRVLEYAKCLFHLNDSQRAAYFATLGPGSDIDHRGTRLTTGLIDDLLHAVRASEGDKPRFGSVRFQKSHFVGLTPFGGMHVEGSARFDDAVFTEKVCFDGANFDSDAIFDRVEFKSGSAFNGVLFNGVASFDESQFDCDGSFLRARFTTHSRFQKVQFSRDAWFNDAHFANAVRFNETKFARYGHFIKAQFAGDAWFVDTQFSRDVLFFQAQFDREAHFGGTRFVNDAWFREAQFRGSFNGSVVCAGRVNFSGAVFSMPVTLQIAAHDLICVRTRWESTATLRVRYAAVDLTDAVLSAPLAVTSHASPFATSLGSQVEESLLASLSPRVKIRSIQGVDAAYLLLIDTDLSHCLFAGAFHLDQIRLEGGTSFAPVPEGLQWRRGIWPVRWSKRRTVAEEHHWRAQTYEQEPLPQTSGDFATTNIWRSGAHHGDPALTPDPEDVAAVYRQLRKAFEDGKNEPGAADFYYGEMEMRRHDQTATPSAERALLHGYWLMSGYGLRASRALAWLAASMLATIILMMAFGLPQQSPKQKATGVVPSGGGRVTLEIDKEDPKNPVRNRFTGKRFEKSMNITLNSVIFRSSGQDLTTAGNYIEMTSRLLEPALLAIALLAVRGRVKR
ncbi:pentapeptide repeat-containing protein [Streptomyces sp. NPDC001492]